MTLESINQMSHPQFVEALGGIFEHSPWVAERTWVQLPFQTVELLHSAMAAVVTAASIEEQLNLICAHPDLGTRAKMSPESTSEQAGAGLDGLTPAEFETLHQFNDAYRNKFKFPFIYAVKGSTKFQILHALEERLGNSIVVEQQNALTQIYRIAQFRLSEAIHE